MATSAQLDQIVKAYDIRGTVPDQLDADVAYALGVGFATFTSASVAIVGRDMRPSGPDLADAFSRVSWNTASTSSTSDWPPPT